MFELTTPLICLAAAMYHEARGESIMGELAVGQVVMTRVKDPRWPNDVCSVVKQGGEHHGRCHFSFYCDGLSDVPREEEAWKRSKLLASFILDNPIYYDPTDGSNHYHNKTVKPYWTASFKQEAIIGHHIFYKDK